VQNRFSLGIKSEKEEKIAEVAAEEAAEGKMRKTLAGVD